MLKNGTRQIKRLGWIPDLPDKRDLRVDAPIDVAALPAGTDLRSIMPLPPFDQGDLGSCTANATVGAIVYDQAKQGMTVTMMSRLYLYYFSRKIEHTVSEDSGAMLRDVMKAWNKFGICPEQEWPYDISQFAACPAPSDQADAKQHRPLQYRRVNQSINSIKSVLAGGYPVVFGFTVYDSFESDEVAQTGKMPMPSPSENVLGGHAVLAVGYDQDNVIVRNSWGTSWGDSGYFYMPWAYITDPNLADDLWVVKQVS